MNNYIPYKIMNVITYPCHSINQYLLVKRPLVAHPLTHCGRVMHICINNWTIIGSDNCLSPGQCQAIICTNAGILLICTLGTNISGILSDIHAFLLKKLHLKTLSSKRGHHVSASKCKLSNFNGQDNSTPRVVSKYLVPFYPLHCQLNIAIPMRLTHNAMI